MTYSNYATANVALWLSEDEGLYKIVKSTEGSYKDLQAIFLEEFQLIVTPDLESFHGRDLDHHELNVLLHELRED